MPTVSVVIPVYNRAHLIPRALESVLHQTFSDFEVVIVDDGSTDDLASAVESFADPRVRLVCHAKRMGGAAARNTGIEDARSDLMAFLDSDDEWMKEKLERQVEAMNSVDGVGRPVIIGSRARRNWQTTPATGEGRWVSTSGRDVRLSLLGAARWSVKVHWSTMLAPRQELINIGGFDPALPAAQWWDLVHRLTERCDFLLGTERLLVQHDPQGERIRQTANIGRAAEILLSKYDMAAPEAKVMRSHMLTSSALYRMTRGEYLNPLASLTTAFVTHPGFRAASRIGGALLGGRAYFTLQRLLGRPATGARERNIRI